MKLITAVVSKDDASSVQRGLTSAGFSVTRTSSSGGFLMSGNVTFIIALEDSRVDEAIAVIAAKSEKRKHIITPASLVGEELETQAVPIEVDVGGAMVIVQNIERFEKL